MPFCVLPEPGRRFGPLRRIPSGWPSRNVGGGRNGVAPSWDPMSSIRLALRLSASLRALGSPPRGGRSRQFDHSVPPSTVRQHCLPSTGWSWMRPGRPPGRFLFRALPRCLERKVCDGDANGRRTVREKFRDFRCHSGTFVAVPCRYCYWRVSRRPANNPYFMGISSLLRRALKLR
jgi:hypothetical protein